MTTARLVFFLFAVILFKPATCVGGSPQRLVEVQREAGESNPSSKAIWISVHNKNGASAEVAASDLEVKLDGKPTFVSDAHRSTPALRYCLLLDVSASTRSTQKTLHDKAVAVLSKIPRADRDYGLLVTFNDQAYLDAESADPQKLVKSIHQDGRGATAMYDAMIACSGYLSNSRALKDEGDTPLRLIFVLSDGVDNASRASRDDAQWTLVEAGIRVYSIGEESVGTYRSDQVAKTSKALKQLVEATGGKDYLPDKRMTIDQIVQDISSDLSNLYALTLSSEKAVPTRHVYKLEVRCRKADCAVIAPREYLASH